MPFPVHAQLALRLKTHSNFAPERPTRWPSRTGLDKIMWTERMGDLPSRGKASRAGQVPLGQRMEREEGGTAHTKASPEKVFPERLFNSKDFASTWKDWTPS